MTDIKLDSNHDLVIENGDLVLAEDTEAIAQHLEIRLKMFKGEWFRNPNEGMPYFQRILKKQPTLQSVVSVFREAIINTPGVDRIEKINTAFDAKTRTFSLSFRARTTEGELLEFNEFVLDIT